MHFIKQNACNKKIYCTLKFIACKLRAKNYFSTEISGKISLSNTQKNNYASEGLNAVIYMNKDSTALEQEKEDLCLHLNFVRIFLKNENHFGFKAPGTDIVAHCLKILHYYEMRFAMRLNAAMAPCAQMSELINAIFSFPICHLLRQCGY